MRSRREPMKTIVGSLRGHRGLIRNCFRAQKLDLSGVVKGLNYEAKVTVKTSRGFPACRTLELVRYCWASKLPRT
jgi:hypothetical protein